MQTLKDKKTVSLHNEKTGITFNYEHEIDQNPDRIDFHRVNDKTKIDISGNYTPSSGIFSISFHTMVNFPDKELVDSVYADIKSILIAEIPE